MQFGDILREWLARLAQFGDMEDILRKEGRDGEREGGEREGGTHPSFHATDEIKHEDKSIPPQSVATEISVAELMVVTILKEERRMRD